MIQVLFFISQITWICDLIIGILSNCKDEQTNQPKNKQTNNILIKKLIKRTKASVPGRPDINYKDIFFISMISIVYFVV